MRNLKFLVPATYLVFATLTIAMAPNGAMAAATTSADEAAAAALSQQLILGAKAMPASASTQDIEAQLALVIERSNASSGAIVLALNSASESPGLSANAKAALKALARVAIANNQKRPFGIGAVGGGLGGAPSGTAPGFVGGGGSDYQ